MASFIVHDIALKVLISILEKEYGIVFTKEQQFEFLMGNLIVDSSKLKFNGNEDTTYRRTLIQQEKIATHFRDSYDLDLCIQVPNLEKFENKYRHFLSNRNLSVIGYLFHLYTDKMFFDNLFTETFETLDKDMVPTIYSNENKIMRVKKNNRVYTSNEFWDGNSQDSIYHDYTVMNKLLLNHFGVTFDKQGYLSEVERFVNPGIEEVDFSNIGGIINEMDVFVKESFEIKGDTLNIFDGQVVITFIENIAYDFIKKYGYLFGINRESKNILIRTNN